MRDTPEVDAGPFSRMAARLPHAANAPFLMAVLTVQALVFAGAIARQGLSGPTVGYAATAALEFLPMVLGAAALRVVIALVRRRLRPAPEPTPLLDGRKLAAWTWDLAWIVAAVAVLTTAYTWTKLYLPALGGTLWDGRLATLDRKLAFGVDPNIFMITIFEGAPRWVARLLDFHYAKFVVTMLAGTAWFLTEGDRSRRLRFAWGAAGVWSLGLWLYVAMPALGPVFTFAGLSAEVSRIFPLAAQAQMALLANYRRVLQVLANPGASVLVVPEMGVAAMPSLHVALHAFLAMWAVRTSSLLRTPLIICAMLTFIGSVALGWHYAIDSWAGLALAFAVFALVAWTGRRKSTADA